MCKVTKEAVIRANNRMKGSKIREYTDFNGHSFTVSVCYLGKNYTQEITMENIRNSFKKAMNAHATKL